MKGQTYPRRGLHGEVVHRIGVRIVRGELGPGEPLPSDEDAIAELGISRTVWREAVKVLAAKGLVEARPKTGTRVRPRSAWNHMDPDVLAWRIEAGPDESFIRDVFAVRRLIEPAAARLAAERAGEAELAELDQAYAEMESATDDTEAYVAADLRFHTTIFRACHNELLEQIGATLRAVYRASFTFTLTVRGSSTDALPRHWAIVEAIRARDGDTAERALLDLLEKTAAQYLKVG